MNSLQKKIATNYGLLAGLVFAIYYFGVYVFNPNLFAGYLKSILFFVVVGFLIISNIEYRKSEIIETGKESGYANFRELLGLSVLIILITSLVSTISSLVVFQVLDPALAEKLTQMQIDKVVELQGRFNLDEQTIDEAIDELKGANAFSLVAHGRTFLFWFVIYTLVAVITGLATQRKQVEPFNQTE